MRPTVEIVGAGPAGLSASLAVARGGRAVVSERRAEVGMRFHGDFQGLENWTTEGDVLEELAGLGIEPTFEHTAFRECVFYDPEGREHVYRSSKCLWYLVRRGSSKAGESPEDGGIRFFRAREQRMASFEREYLTSLLRTSGGDVSQAAREARVPRGTFYRLLKKNGIDPAPFRGGGCR